MIDNSFVEKLGKINGEYITKVVKLADEYGLSRDATVERSIQALFTVAPTCTFSQYKYGEDSQ